MEDFDNKASEIFIPKYVDKIKQIHGNNIRFVHYTSAEAAMNIIKNREVWLRNTQ